jgi:hypothetical protein
MNMRKNMTNFREMRERLLSNSGGHGFGQSEEGDGLKFSAYWKDNKVNKFGLCSPARSSSALKALERASKKGNRLKRISSITGKSHWFYIKLG